MRKLFTAAILALVCVGITPALAQVSIQLDATGSFDFQSGANCTLQTHTYPGAEASEDGELWTRDCTQNANEGMTFPFNWPLGVPPAAGSKAVTLGLRVDAPGGNGLTTTFVCHSTRITCRDTPVLGVPVPSPLEGEADFAVTTELVSQTADVRNTDTVSFLHKINVGHDNPGAAGARCELTVVRCNDDTPFEVGYEYAIIDFE